MAFRTAGKGQKERKAEEDSQAASAAAHKPDAISALLAMEEVAKDLALTYPDGPNCDAVKAALRNASHGIAHVRKVLAQNARLA